MTSTTLLTQAAGLTVALLVLTPLVVLAHELGHALASLLLSGGSAEVRVGRARGRGVRLGRLRVALSPLPTLSASPLRGSCLRRNVHRSAGTELAVLVAGPLATALAATALAAGALLTREGPPLAAPALAYGALLGLLALVSTSDAGRVRLVWRVWRHGGVLPRDTPDVAPVTPPARHEGAAPTAEPGLGVGY